MALDELYKVFVTGIRDTNIFGNRYYYLGASAASNALGLAESIRDDVLPAITSIMHNSGRFVSVSVVNEDNNGDQALININLPGLEPGDKLRDFYVAAMELTPLNGIVKVGRKAFSPLDESDWNGSAPLASTAIELANIASDLIATLTDGSGESYNPVLYSPATATRPIEVITSIISANFKRISTQNSRKPY